MTLPLIYSFKKKVVEKFYKHFRTPMLPRLLFRDYSQKKRRIFLTHSQLGSNKIEMNEIFLLLNFCRDQNRPWKLFWYFISALRCGGGIFWSPDSSQVHSVPNFSFSSLMFASNRFFFSSGA